MVQHNSDFTAACTVSEAPARGAVGRSRGGVQARLDSARGAGGERSVQSRPGTCPARAERPQRALSRLGVVHNAKVRCRASGRILQSPLPAHSRRPGQPSSHERRRTGRSAERTSDANGSTWPCQDESGPRLAHRGVQVAGPRGAQTRVGGHRPRRRHRAKGRARAWEGAWPGRGRAPREQAALSSVPRMTSPMRPPGGRVGRGPGPRPVPSERLRPTSPMRPVRWVPARLPEQGRAHEAGRALGAAGVDAEAG